MTAKIKGEFLKVDQEGSKYKIHYIGDDGKPYSIMLPKENMNSFSDQAARAIERLRLKLSGITDSKELAHTNNLIEFYTIESLRPEMFIAICKGEDLKRFFETKDEPSKIAPAIPEHFQQVFEAFRLQCSNQFREGYEKLNQKINALLRERIEENRKETEKTGLQISWDRFPILVQGYRYHSELIGEDFLSSYSEIIHPHCGIITDAQSSELFTLLQTHYSLAMDRAESAAKAYFDSQNIPENQAAVSRARGQYSNPCKKYERRLTAEILKHNLSVGVGKTSEKIYHENLGNLAISQNLSEIKIQQGITKQYLKDRCEEECEKRGISKFRTISRETKFEIAQAIGIRGVDSLESFKGGNPAYQKISTILSVLKYCKKNPDKLRK